MQKLYSGDQMTAQNIGTGGAPVKLKLNGNSDALATNSNNALRVWVEVFIDDMPATARNLTIQYYRASVGQPQRMGGKKVVDAMPATTECVIQIGPLIIGPGNGNVPNLTFYLSSDIAGDNSVTINVDVWSDDAVIQNTTPVTLNGAVRVDVGEWVGTVVTINGTSNKPQVDVAAVGGATPMSLADITAAILAGVIEGAITLKEAQRLMLAVLTGKVSGGGTTTVTFRDTGDAKDRITATITEVGDRTAVARDAS